MELTPYLPTAIFVATIATVVLAVLSYAAFKVRDWRRPQDEGAPPIFFRRYQPPGGADPGATRGPSRP